MRLSTDELELSDKIAKILEYYNKSMFVIPNLTKIDFKNVPVNEIHQVA